METTMNVFFKSMQKDDKKEVLKFEIKGSEDADGEIDLFDLSGSIVVFSLSAGGDAVAEDVPAEFLSIQRDSKKTTLKFAMKGDSEAKAQELYRVAGRNVALTVAPSQMSIDEFNEDPREGVRGKINGDGTVDMDNNQLTIEDAARDDEDPDGVEEEYTDLPNDLKDED
jgi:hypothetical protein